MISAASIAGSVVLRWTNDHGVSGSNPSGAPFDILHFVRDLLFPLLKNSKSVRYLSREINLIFLEIEDGGSDLELEDGWLCTPQ